MAMLPPILEVEEQQDCIGAYHSQFSVYLISLWTCSSNAKVGSERPHTKVGGHCVKLWLLSQHCAEFGPRSGHEALPLS